MKLLVLLALYVATTALPSSAQVSDCDVARSDFTLNNGTASCKEESSACPTACADEIDNLFEVCQLPGEIYDGNATALSLWAAGSLSFVDEVCVQVLYDKLDDLSDDTCQTKAEIAGGVIFVGGITGNNYCASEVGECQQYCQDILTEFTNACSSTDLLGGINAREVKFFQYQLFYVLSTDCSNYAKTLKFKDGFAMGTFPTGTSAASFISLFATAPVVFIASIFMHSF